ncbi:MAG: iron export ABC transporter permease subunit FetB [Phormidium sp. BM_Day4_Bin.17]|nr:iron export ABC transporter permease subunit FetB [Phormidium sp. BM_Day4_Bin.17]UCJ13573.1 MAG: iron export ABC transporter permease subunit FetB [Phormidium sp. PBR-2020]
MDYIQLDLIDLAIALGMAAIAIAIAAWQQLGLTLQLSLATARTTVQLLMLGVILQVVFTWRHPLLLLGVLLVMLSLAAVVARNRITRKLPRLLPLVWAAIGLSTAVTLIYINTLVLRQPAVWSNPQYLIPLGGMMMGNAMNAAAIAGERFVSLVQHHPLEIETHLSLGATPQQALAAYHKQAIRAGTVSILNSMMVVGLVTLPGIVTGQLLSGASPIDAAAYQMLIMFAIALTDFIATTLLVTGLGRRFFNEAAQLQPF